MTSVSAAELKCIYPQLSTTLASTYASALSAKMGSALGNKCAWASFLANVGTESAGLTEWTQLPCNSATAAPFCGRGPLQITGYSNYKYCASQPVCDCSGIVSSPSGVSSSTSTGVGTAACVWETLSGSSLSKYADGTETGLLQVACIINAGHYPCGYPNGWSSRKSYWEAANSCLAGASGSASDPYLAGCPVGYADEPLSVTETGPDGSYTLPQPAAWAQGRDAEIVLDPSMPIPSADLANRSATCTDQATGVPFTGVMRSLAGASVLSPLTSLVAAYRSHLSGDTERAVAWVLERMNLPEGLALLMFDAPRSAFGGSPTGRSVMAAGLRVDALVKFISAVLPTAINASTKAHTVLTAAAELHSAARMRGLSAANASRCAAASLHPSWPVCESDVQEVLEASKAMLSVGVLPTSESVDTHKATASVKVCAAVLGAIAAHEKGATSAGRRRLASSADDATAFFLRYAQLASAAAALSGAVGSSASSTLVIEYSGMSTVQLEAVVEAAASDGATSDPAKIRGLFCGDPTASNYVEGGAAATGSSYCKYGRELPHVHDANAFEMVPRGECMSPTVGYTAIGITAGLASCALVALMGYIVYSRMSSKTPLASKEWVNKKVSVERMSACVSDPDAPAASRASARASEYAPQLQEVAKL